MPAGLGRRGLGVTLATAGLALAAAATGTGPYFRADRDVQPFVLPFDAGFGFGGGDRGGTGDGLGLGFASELGQWLGILLTAVTGLTALALVVAALVGLVRGLRQLTGLVLSRSRAVVVPADYEPGESTTDDALAAVRRRLLDQLELSAAELTSGPPREVVIACYLGMLAAAAAAGTPRRAHETPNEVVRRMLAEQDVPGAAAESLTALYEEARFSTHVIDGEMRVSARAALAAVRGALVAESAGPVTEPAW